ncbi:MAG TPA: type II toxin-antitoxin system CcdA family antitoxin [Rubrivivax sp.]|nr:type II toxin-antitoxin system CcdA family antitoxin [Rubrivivax sp.]
MASNTAHPLRRPASVTVDAALLDRAEEIEIDISKASEEGLARAVRQRQAASWLEANRAALQSSNEFVERHGLPPAQHRNFWWRASTSTSIVAQTAGCSTCRRTCSAA